MPEKITFSLPVEKTDAQQEKIEEILGESGLKKHCKRVELGGKSVNRDEAHNGFPQYRQYRFYVAQDTFKRNRAEFDEAYTKLVSAFDNSNAELRYEKQQIDELRLG